jgi:hypothetical protein
LDFAYSANSDAPAAENRESIVWVIHVAASAAVFSAESFESQADPSTGARELNSACPEIVLLMPESHGARSGN